MACFEVLVARDTCKEGRCLVVHQGHLKAVVALLIGCAVLLLEVGCAGGRSESPKEQGHTQATKKEQTRSPGARVSEETTALEETSAFQAPEGTRTSSTARIACLRQKEGAPLPTNGTEALDDGILTRVLTPKVEAQTDGVHLQIDLRLRKPAGYTINVARATPLESYSDGGYLRKGITNDVIQAPPGIAEIQCYPSENYDFRVRKYAHFEVVAGESGYKSKELECKPGAEITGTGVADIGGYTGSHPVAQAREHFSERLKEGDLVEEAGYPEGPSPPVRVVRDGKVMATIDYDAGGYEVVYCNGQF